MTIAAGADILATDVTALTTRIAALESPPRCRAWSSAGVASSANNSLVLVPLDSESYDSASMHSTGTNNSRIVIPSAGTYKVLAQANWSANATGRRAISVRLNAAGSGSGGTEIMLASRAPAPASGTQLQVADELVFAQNDYIEMFTLQSSGGTLTVGGGQYATWLLARKVA
ncbi:hypothetical protein [Asanoa siamensis]|uniref:C1q domain-containing protein n=1 Tax=Asanoa siamensis TaxID=926357 RepID=A0ABQ4CKU4_9ACTN|nr:hypothetical protein [Asanoa siamensis]GIF71914.1 hypothetical protein Asi02nite_14320 [Asanoa siamensis]